MWIDLDVFPGGISDLKSGLERSIILNQKAKTWAAELAIPMKSLTTNFDPTAVWRANFYRVERPHRTSRLSRVAADQNSRAELSRPQRVWKSALCSSVETSACYVSPCL